jgi:hypothetical protein
VAIDSAAKRNSALLDPGNMPWPPDGTIAVGDRLVMLEFYSGIAAEPPSEPVFRTPTYRPTAGSQPSTPRPAFPGIPSSPRLVRRLPPSTYRPDNPISPVT